MRGLKVALTLYTARNEVRTVVKATFIISKLVRTMLLYDFAELIYKYLVKFWVPLPLVNGKVSMPAKMSVTTSILCHVISCHVMSYRIVCHVM